MVETEEDVRQALVGDIHDAVWKFVNQVSQPLAASEEGEPQVQLRPETIGHVLHALSFELGVWLGGAEGVGVDETALRAVISDGSQQGKRVAASISDFMVPMTALVKN